MSLKKRPKRQRPLPVPTIAVNNLPQLSRTHGLVVSQHSVNTWKAPLVPRPIATLCPSSEQIHNLSNADFKPKFSAVTTTRHAFARPSADLPDTRRGKGLAQKARPTISLKRCWRRSVGRGKMDPAVRIGKALCAHVLTAYTMLTSRPKDPQGFLAESPANQGMNRGGCSLVNARGTFRSTERHHGYGRRRRHIVPPCVNRNGWGRCAFASREW